MTESNTPSDVGQNVPKPKGIFKSFQHGEKRYMGAHETPRERMARVVNTVRKGKRAKSRHTNR